MQDLSTHATLLNRLSAGHDPGAWNDFCDRYSALIQGFARRQGLQSADCDDVVQETLLALTKSMGRFQYEPAKGRFRSYLKTVVLHTIFRRTRQKQGEVSLEEIEAAVSHAADDQEIDQKWEAEWRQYHLREAMKTVSAEFNEKDLAAFDAYAVNGREVSTVASQLDLNVDQVYQAKSRILKRLGELVASLVDEEG